MHPEKRISAEKPRTLVGQVKEIHVVQKRGELGCTELLLPRRDQVHIGSIEKCNHICVEMEESLLRIAIEFIDIAGRA